MANCAYCNTFILFGGVSDAKGRYCNPKCYQSGQVMRMAQNIPPHVLDSLIDQVHQGECPRCNRPGPVDIHKAHRVWSAVVLTSWSSSPDISCKRCAIKRQLGASLFSGVLGWWGLPWGIVLTPVQIFRNLIGIFGGPSSAAPSSLLKDFVRVQAVAHGLGQEQVPSSAVPPPLPAPLFVQDDGRYRPQ